MSGVGDAWGPDARRCGHCNGDVGDIQCWSGHTLGSYVLCLPCLVVHEHYHPSGVRLVLSEGRTP